MDWSRIKGRGVLFEYLSRACIEVNNRIGRQRYEYIQQIVNNQRCVIRTKKSEVSRRIAANRS